MRDPLSCHLFLGFKEHCFSQPSEWKAMVLNGHTFALKFHFRGTKEAFTTASSFSVGQYTTHYKLGIKSKMISCLGLCLIKA